MQEKCWDARRISATLPINFMPVTYVEETTVVGFCSWELHRPALLASTALYTKMFERRSNFETPLFAVIEDRAMSTVVTSSSGPHLSGTSN